jgi:selenium metabolism protein YedF
MSKIIDARGLKCPEPTIQTGRALKDYDEIMVIVDDEAAVQNISTGVKKRGYEVQMERKGKDFYLHIQRGDEKVEDSTPSRNTVVLFTSDRIGRGDSELGRILTGALLYSFVEVEPKPQIIIFMNSGIKLVIEGSSVLDDLSKLADEGVEILSCGTCLDFYGLKDKIAVGQISNAYTIAEILLGAEKVVGF